MTQTEARQEARSLNEDDLVPDGLVAVAVTDPVNAWGGHERDWMVAYYVLSE